MKQNVSEKSGSCLVGRLSIPSHKAAYGMQRRVLRSALVALSILK